MIRPLLTVFLLSVLVSPAAGQNWQLVWADEFDGTEVDTTRWSFQTGDGCPDLCGWGNGEEQYYLPDNATVENGRLSITVKKDSTGGRAFTSSRMRTKGKASWTYGRIETRAKMPAGAGYWPAIWMMPEDDVYGTWAASGEIDILEVFGNDPGTVHGTIHFGGVSPANTRQGGSYTLPLRDFSRSFHDFAIEWVPGEIRWYVDGRLYHTQQDWYSTEGRFPAPFDESFHLIMNVAVGGAGGEPGTGTSFPQAMEVEYIRVYQSANEAPTVELTAPLEGAQVDPGSSLTLSASAMDTDGEISRVTFYAGDAELTTTDVEPYEVTLDGVAAGCYSYRARAVDNLGGDAWSTPVSVVAGACGQAPYRSSPSTVPGIFQAEDFDLGGEGVAFHDNDAANTGVSQGGTYRVNEAVDIEYVLGSRQGHAVTAFEAGEWMEYTVDVVQTGAFDLDLRVESTSGARLDILVDGAPVAEGLEVAASEGFSTVRASSLAMQEGPAVLRIAVQDGDLRFDFLDARPYTEPPPAGVVVFEDFSDASIDEWEFFGSATAEITAAGGLNAFMRATFDGSGGSGGAFYGVIWKNLPDDHQLILPADPWLNLRVRHSSTATTVDRYAFEVTVREDTDGDGYTEGSDDSFRLDTFFDPPSFNDEWIQIAAPLSSFTNLGTGGNGILEVALDEVVFVVSRVTGPDPSGVQIDIDDVVISTGALGTGRESGELPSATRVEALYPNPARDFVSVPLTLEAVGPVTIEVYDLLGRRVRTVSKGVWPAGTGIARVDLERLSPGLYFVRVNAPGLSAARPVVVAR